MPRQMIRPAADSAGELLLLMIVPVLDRKAAKPSQDLCLDLSGAQEAEDHVIPHIVQGFV